MNSPTRQTEPRSWSIERNGMRLIPRITPAKTAPITQPAKAAPITPPAKGAPITSSAVASPKNLENSVCEESPGWLTQLSEKITGDHEENNKLAIQKYKIKSDRLLKIAQAKIEFQSIQARMLAYRTASICISAGITAIVCCLILSKV